MVTVSVTNFACFMSRPALQRGMSKEQHPLIKHLKETGESLTDFAARVKMSRMQLYRIMSGESTTTATLQKIAAATENAVPMSAFLEAAE